MPALGLSWALGLLAGLVLATVSGDRLRWAAAGLIVAALGAASLRVGVGSEVPADLARLVATASADRFFVAVDVGLVLLGLAIVAVGSRAWMPALGSVLVSFLLMPLLQVTGVVQPVGHAAIAAGVLALGWAGASLLTPGRFLLVLDRRALDPAIGGGTPSVDGRLPWRSWLPTAAAVLACLVPHAVLTLVLAMAAMGAAAFLPVRTRGVIRLALPLALFLTGLSLALAITIIGPLPGSYAALREGPFSDAASVLLVMLVGAAAWITSGTWPWHATVPVPALLPVAWALLGRFGLGAVPFGIGYWQPLAVPVALMGVAHGLATGRPGRVFAALGMAGLWTGSMDGSALLFASALVMDGSAGSRWSEVLPGPMRRIAWLVPGAGGLLVLGDLLEAQVTYAVLLSGILILGLLPALKWSSRGVASSPR